MAHFQLLKDDENMATIMFAVQILLRNQEFGTRQYLAHLEHLSHSSTDGHSTHTRHTHTPHTHTQNTHTRHAHSNAHTPPHARTHAHSGAHTPNAHAHARARAHAHTPNSNHAPPYTHAHTPHAPYTHAHTHHTFHIPHNQHPPHQLTEQLLPRDILSVHRPVPDMHTQEAHSSTVQQRLAHLEAAQITVCCRSLQSVAV